MISQLDKLLSWGNNCFVDILCFYQYYAAVAPNSPFLMTQLLDYFPGGVDDCAGWVIRKWNDLNFMFENGLRYDKHQLNQFVYGGRGIGWGNLTLFFCFHCWALGKEHLTIYVLVFFFVFFLFLNTCTWIFINQSLENGKLIQGSKICTNYYIYNLYVLMVWILALFTNLLIKIQVSVGWHG